MRRKKQVPPAMTAEELSAEHEAFDAEFTTIYNGYQEARRAHDGPRADSWFHLYLDMKDRERMFFMEHAPVPELSV